MLATVEQALVDALGPVQARAGVTFVGVAPVEVLRFAADGSGAVHYATLGMSVSPMSGAAELTTEGPRAELVLTLAARRDDVLRSLAVLAAAPAVEGVVLAPGAGVDHDEPLWPGARFTAWLVGAPGVLVPDVHVPDVDPVQVLPVTPMTRHEAAWKRVHGAAALEERWLVQGLDPRDPGRPEADLR